MHRLAGGPWPKQRAFVRRERGPVSPPVVRDLVGVLAEQLGLVVVAEQVDGCPVQERELPFVIDDIETVRRLFGDAQDVLDGGCPCRLDRGVGVQGPIIALRSPGV
jgi:hypothetical protein